jgi:hypothetical protein
MQKRQQTEDQTCIKLGPGMLGTRMETHQPPPPPVSLLYTVATGSVEAFLRGGGCDIVILGNRRNLWQLLSEHKHLRKNRCKHLAHFCSWGCANSSVQFIGYNYACSLLRFGAVPNSNTQLIRYICQLTTGHRILFQFVFRPSLNLNNLQILCPASPW